jgi:hypothetical protein
MPLLSLLESLFKWLLVLALAGLILGYWNRDRLPQPEFYDEALEQAPRQTATRRAPFTTRAGAQHYRITPLFDYELHGVVVSQHHSDDWLDIYHHQDWQDYLNIKDICVIWGDNVRSAVYQDLEFENTTWTCWVHWPDRATRRRFRDNQLANNHLLADRPAVTQAILAARPGDQVYLRGMLAEYANPANGFQRGTSTSRNDRGNGACETVYVEEFRVLRHANPGWRRLFVVSLWLTPLAALGWVAMLALAPVRRGAR